MLSLISLQNFSNFLKPSEKNVKWSCISQKMKRKYSVIFACFPDEKILSLILWYEEFDAY